MKKLFAAAGLLFAFMGASAQSYPDIFHTDIPAFFNSLHQFNADRFQVLKKFALGKRTGTYIGQLVNGIPDGMGVFKSDDGTYFYVGDFKNGKRAGFCIYKYLSTDQSDGLFLGTDGDGGMRRGIYVWPNMNNYFSINAFDSEQYQTGWILSGELVGGDPTIYQARSAKGEKQFESKYFSILDEEGLGAQFVDISYNEGGRTAIDYHLFKKELAENCDLYAFGRKHYYNSVGNEIGDKQGEGIYTQSVNPLFKSGGKVSGAYIISGDDEIMGFSDAPPDHCELNGKGFATFRSGGVYGCLLGAFAHNKLKGEGINYSNQAFIYSSNWIGNSPSGFTLMVLPDGSVCIGHVENGMVNGLYATVSADNIIFIGNMSNNNRMNGFEYNFSDNTVYYGAYSNNDRAGGTLIGEGGSTKINQ